MTYHLTYTAPLLEPWRDKAACVGRFDVFFPAEGSDADDAEAKEICGTCPVADSCLSSALADEGNAPAYARVGIRGGWTATTRARSAGAATEAEEPQSYDEVDRLLRLATMTDKAVALQLGIGTTTVHRRRKALGLPAFQVHAETLEEAFALGSRPVEGSEHVVWRSGTSTLNFRDQNVTITRLAFRLGRGRDADGPVQRSCEHDGCIAWRHLTDRPLRAQLCQKLGQAA